MADTCLERGVLSPGGSGGSGTGGLALCWSLECLSLSFMGPACSCPSLLDYILLIFVVEMLRLTIICFLENM